MVFGTSKDRLSGTLVSEGTGKAFVQAVQLVDGSGNAVVQPGTALTAQAPASVNSAATSTTLVAANADRKALTIRNTDEYRLYIDPAGGTATSAAPIYLDTGDIWRMDDLVTGEITGIWAANGSGAAVSQEYE